MVDEAAVNKREDVVVELVGWRPSQHDGRHIEHDVLRGLEHDSVPPSVQKGEEDGTQVHDAHDAEPGVQLQTARRRYHCCPHQGVVSKGAEVAGRGKQEPQRHMS